MPEERLQKIIARAGVCSRREAEKLIRDGRVTVNGRVAELGASADPEADHVKVDGKLLRAPEPSRYLLLYKPREVVTTTDDPEGRPTVLDLVRGVVRERIYPVGRLDYHSEGLLLLTNDGDLAAKVTHPRHGVQREYLAKIKGDLDESERRRLLDGTTIDGRRVKPLRARRERVLKASGNSWWRITVAEGRTHEVRELFFRAGHHVQRLKRTAIGPIRDTALGPGDFRMLTASEVAALLAAATGGQGGRRGGGRKPRRTSRRKP